MTIGLLTQSLVKKFTGPFPMAFRADRLEKELVAERKPLVPLAGVQFGTVFTDHMFLGVRKGGQWTLKIMPHQNLKLLPQVSVFQYGTCAFEGMKAFRDSSGQVRLFRPDLNWARFVRSCDRLDGPAIDAGECQKILEELLRIEERWVPHERGYSLYIRPTMAGIVPALGSKINDDTIMFIILSPVGPYYSTGFKPVALWACTEYARAWYGATGCYKVGANYAITVMPGELAHKKNCQQVLWLSGPERYITEVGSMNLLGIWINKAGEKELITAPLDDGLILPGVTRESILALAREDGELKVTEGKWTIDELLEAIREKRVIEVFGSGTAAVISPVNKILYNDEWIDVPVRADDPDAAIGVYAERYLTRLQDIQYGVVEHPWSVVLTP
jgi:branched-chain amino acid aminotransferase